MTTPAARTKAKGTRGHGKRLSERPKLLFVFATGFSLIIGLVNGAIDFPLGGILGLGVFLALVIVILSAAALAVVAAVGSIKREELDVEFWLFFAGPIAGV